MAAMIPAVEVGRRRRFHQSGGRFGSHSVSAAHSSLTGRSSFSLYSSINFESRLCSTSFMRNCDQKLNDAAREANQRVEKRATGLREMQNEIPRLKKKSGWKWFCWPKLSWKSSEQKECAVCLEQFVAGEKLMQLPCAHRFHSRCLAPWLEKNTHCPCCRMELA